MSFTQHDATIVIQLDQKIEFYKQLINTESSLTEPCQEYIEYLRQQQVEYENKLFVYKCKFFIAEHNTPIMKEYRKLKIKDMINEGRSQSEILMHFMP